MPIFLKVIRFPIKNARPLWETFHRTAGHERANIHSTLHCYILLSTLYPLQDQMNLRNLQMNLRNLGESRIGEDHRRIGGQECALEWSGDMECALILLLLLLLTQVV
jgi:hypothetical protein